MDKLVNGERTNGEQKKRPFDNDEKVVCDVLGAINKKDCSLRLEAAS